MLLQILATLDIVSAFWLLLLQYFDLSLKISYILGIYLISKFVIFQDGMSLFDAVCGVVILFAAYHHFSPFTYIFILYLVAKGIFSMIYVRS
jgi:hypothetical protein